MQIKIYFSDLKPEKQRELLNLTAKQRKIKPGSIILTSSLPSPLAILVLEDEEDYPDDASERLEQEAQWKGEEQIKEKPKLSDFREFDF